jgi:hypothetical protein
MMKNKSRISISLISFITLFLGVIFYLSYYFYSISKQKDPITTVSINDKASIDSIKTFSVKDTVNFFVHRVDKLLKENELKDSIIIRKDSSNRKLKRIIDSLEIKNDYLKEKIKMKNDTVR